jgi:hypothetical protein
MTMASRRVWIDRESWRHEWSDCRGLKVADGHDRSLEVSPTLSRAAPPNPIVPNARRHSHVSLSHGFGTCFEQSKPRHLALSGSFAANGATG